MLKRISVFFVFPILVLGCNKPPKACIDIGQTTVSTGVSITFTSCSKRTLSQEWFMSGPIGAPENSIGWSDAEIQNTFTVPGNYTITLNAYSKFSFMGDVSTATQVITVQ